MFREMNFSAHRNDRGRDGARNTQHAAFTFPVSRIAHHASRFTPAFTLIELILVMAILTLGVALTAPALSRFFRGRTLDSEARRLLALTRIGQNRAVSEGVPMDLWLDIAQGKFGLEMEPSYEQADSRSEKFDLDSRLQIEVQTQNAPVTLGTTTRQQAPSVASVPKVALVKPGLPTIRFLPDGFISPTSPQTIRLMDRDGFSLLLTENKARNGYEITTAQN